jgi:hypothetical protein
MDWPVTCSTLTSAAPGISLRIFSISRALPLSVSKSSPKTFTPRSPRTPAIISFTRISIGWVKTIFIPGRASSSFSIAATRSSWVRARFHFPGTSR